MLLHLLRAAVAMDLLAAKEQEREMLQAQSTAPQSQQGSACNGSSTASPQTEPHQVRDLSRVKACAWCVSEHASSRLVSLASPLGHLAECQSANHNVEQSCEALVWRAV